MSDYIVPMTELEAVNELLAAIQEAPITSLSEAAEQSPDAATALVKLRSSARSIQSRGWSWNTDLCFPLTPDATTKEIRLPDGAITLDTTDYYTPELGQYVMRGQRLYDRRNHTFEFEDGVNADIVVLLPFEDMPQAFRDWATKQAARLFQYQIQGEVANFRFSQDEVNQAEATAMITEADLDDSNMFATTRDHTLIRAAVRNRSGR